MLQSDLILEGQAPVASMNSELVPIIIATVGTDFNDKNNTEKAANHIANIIATKELGGFTTDTLPRALHGRNVELTNFTTKVLGNIGVHHFLLFYSDFLILNDMSDPKWHSLLRQLLIKYVTLLTNPEGTSPSAPSLKRKKCLERDKSSEEACAATASAAGGGSNGD
jgi:hypothetical protein